MASDRGKVRDTLKHKEDSSVEVEFLREYWPELAHAYEGLYGGTRLAGSLDDIERALILVGMRAACGSEEQVVETGTAALKAGASGDALVEAVLTAAISRGERAIRTAYPFLSELALVPRNPDSLGVDESPSDYFETQFESLPYWVQQLHAFCPESLTDYAALRSRLLTDGAMSRKSKDLLTMVLNALDGNDGGVKSHAESAAEFGASREEVLEALLLGVGVGGIIVWINGVQSLQGLAL